MFLRKSIFSPMIYDYIIAGAGAAGLSLAFRITQEVSLKNKKVLLIDKADKNKNDRTWSFWHEDKSIFDPIINKTWDSIWFQSPKFSKKITLKPYQYSMIRGIDFYDFMKENLENHPQIDWQKGEISYFEEVEGKATVYLKDKSKYEGKWIFNSALRIKPTLTKGYHYFWQHFKGWVVRTDEPIFDENTATFMDFRIEQKGQARFFYLLPTSARESLVEFTIFSEELVTDEEYNQELQHYFRHYLKLKNFEILETEKGKIPMFDAPFPKTLGARTINIGIAGGSAKASSGYAFRNIQQESEKIVEALVNFDNPLKRNFTNRRFRFYDSMLLNLMKNQRRELRDIFAIMFKKHPIDRIFRFLDDRSNFNEELLIMTGMPSLPFLKSLPTVLQQKDLYVNVNE